MKREEIRNHLMDLVDGTLLPERAREVEEALAQHPDLEQELGDLREAVHLAGQLSVVEVVQRGAPLPNHCLKPRHAQESPGLVLEGLLCLVQEAVVRKTRLRMCEFCRGRKTEDLQT